MTKILNPRAHGFVDYGVVLMFLLAPTLLKFGGTAQIVSYAVAAVHLSLSVLTNYPLGLLKLVPFPVHGAIEFVVVPSLVAMPWLFGFWGVVAARTFFIVSAVMVALVVMVTNYKAAELSDVHLTVE